jgi:hypothetical protein
MKLAKAINDVESALAVVPRDRLSEYDIGAAAEPIHTLACRGLGQEGIAGRCMPAWLPTERRPC